MRIEHLGFDRKQDFIDYCIKHRDKLDDSYLTDDELTRFELSEGNPTYILLDDRNRIAGASSLYKSEYYRRGGKARFRILHAELPDLKLYEDLFKAALKHVDGLKKLIIFCPEKTEDVTEMFNKLGFYIERYAFFLNREDMPVAEWSLPGDYELRVFQFGRDEEDWCKARNAAFAKHLGSETPATPEMIRTYEDQEDNIEGGMKLLYYRSEPVGILRVAKEFKNNEYYTSIDMLGVIPEHQNKGLGRNLLRSGLCYGRNVGMPKATLSVNAENHRAVELYLSEGFYKDIVYAGYGYDLK